MANDISVLDPKWFDLNTFADMLPARDPIPGEDPGTFADFHSVMMRSLAPATPYEGVIAENLVAIEWEPVQHRRMHDASIRRYIREKIIEAVQQKHWQA